MSPRKGPKKTTTLSIEATKDLTERTALLIERIQATLANALTRLQKERYELKEFAYEHFGHISPDKEPTDTPQPSTTQPEEKE